MWTTRTTQEVHEIDSDRVCEITHDFGNRVTVVTNFDKGTSVMKHGEIEVSETELIRDTEKYTMFLNNIDKEVNPKKEECHE